MEFGQVEITAIIGVVILLLIITLGFSGGKAEKKPEKKVAVKETAKVKKAAVGKETFTLEEIATHNKQEDCWIIVNGKVYDVTSYIDEHPGGTSILNNAGADSTEGFKGPQHPASVWDVLDLYYIGKVAEN